MNAWSVGIVVILVPLLLNGIKILSSDKGEFGVVRMPKFFLVFGIVGFCADAVTILLSFSFPEKEYLKLIAIALSCLSLLALVIFTSLHITYDEEGFLVKRLFRKRVYYRYSEIKGVIPGAIGNDSLCMEKGKVYIDQLAVGGIDFLSYAEDRYSEITGAFCMPDIRAGLFRGNVREPLALVVINGLVLVALLGVALYMTFSALLLSPYTRDGLVQETVVFHSVEKKDGDYRLMTDGRYFELWPKTLLDESSHSFLQDIQNGESFLVSYQPVESLKDDKPFRILEMQHEDGTYIVTLDSSHEALKHNWTMVAIFMWGLFVAYSALCAAEYYILCHPERHPILANMIIRKEYQNW